MASTAYLQIKNLSKAFDKSKILTNLSLDLKEGTLLSILGASGCGKTTLLKIIAGLITADSGEIIVDNEIYSNLPVNKRQIGYVPQSQTLFPHMTVEKNIAFGMTKNTSHEEKKKEISALVEICELNGHQTKLPHQLSGGQKQRVSLARALATKPKLLLLDEPLSSLDRGLRQKIAFFVQDIVKETQITTIHVTHDSTEAAVISDELAILESGHIIQSGTPNELLTQPRIYEVARALGIPNVFFSHKQQTHSASPETDIGYLLYQMTQKDNCAFHISDCTIESIETSNANAPSFYIRAIVQSTIFTAPDTLQVTFRVNNGEGPAYIYKEFINVGNSLKNIYKSLDVALYITKISELTKYINANL